MPGASARAFAGLDRDGNGVEDALDAWAVGAATWSDLRLAATAAAVEAGAAAAADAGPAALPDELKAAAGPWASGLIRLLWFDAPTGAVVAAQRKDAGTLRTIHRLDAFGLDVLACDAGGLTAVLAEAGSGRLMLDRDGVPALNASRPLVGADRVRQPGWSLGRDWSATVAILDSGCDTAHGDLGDYSDDNADGPAPAVGDADDWYAADQGWPLFVGYKVVGWTDVTDDFPAAQGPWDYHHHGTALASVVAGSGAVDPAYAGLAPALRLTVVKFYDFDVTWHAWAGDFLAACAWLLDHHDVYRVRTVLAAVNWDQDAGLADAVDLLLDAGLTVVGAAGNQGDDSAGPGWPARLPGVLAVGGVNDAGALAAFSGRGAETEPVKPDLTAPAGGLLPASGRITAADNEPDDTYTGRFGTSLAAAHVAGAAALLDEALADRGVAIPADREGALTRGVLLQATAVPLGQAETADGLGTTSLPAWNGPDRSQGWGLLRIDAAVSAACVPLAPGADQLDTLSADLVRPVAARRLLVQPGVRYLVEAVPSPGLDVILDVVDPRGAISGRDDVSVRRDASGAGVSEFVHVTPASSHWLVLAVKRRAGSGTVTLRLREADAFATQGWRHTLPGRSTGAPNQGRLGSAQQPSLVVPSLVAVDDAARSVTVLNPDGTLRPGWPVYIFPPVSAEGGLGQPLVWDLNGQAGDEIVFGSAYGAMVFFTADGSRIIQQYAFNEPLTTPVGIVGAAERRVISVDGTGRARAWAAGGLLRADRLLGHGAPLTPAVGGLLPGAAEAVVVAFADGHVRVLDADLQDRAGWPRDLGLALDQPPVLVDLDGDGGREIVLAARDESTGLITLRVLDGAGVAGPGDGATLASPEGGPWIAVGPAVVTGRYGTGELGVSVLGLAANTGTGADVRWSLARGVLRADGTAWSERCPGLEIGATTGEGRLSLDTSRLPAPVAWNILGGTGTEPSQLMSLAWRENLNGLTPITGAVTAWYEPDDTGRPLSAWRPRLRNGPDAAAPAEAGVLLLPRGDGSHLRLDVVDNLVSAAAVLSGGDERPVWGSARADGRNSGAYPLDAVVAGVPLAAAADRLAVFPNPGAGRFRFQIAGLEEGAAVRAEIIDVRGRRVSTLGGPLSTLVWDGRGADGRALAAGTYFAVIRTGARTWTTRFVLTH